MQNVENQNNQLEPPPVKIDIETGLKTWIIKDYELTGRTYAEVLEILPLIENSQSL